MGDQIVINWKRLDDLFVSMDEIGYQSDQIASYFRQHVCSEDGLTGALDPLAGAMPKISGWFDDMDGVFDRRWSGVADAVAQSARDLKRVDESIEVDIDRLRGLGPSGDGAYGSPVQGDLPQLTAPKDVSGDLATPERGDDQLNHDGKFEFVADAWDTGIDVITQGIEFLRKLGFDLADPPIPTLRELIIYPLSGDWGAIRANGDACQKCEQGMQTWGNNFSLLSVDVALVIQGRTGVTLAAHLNLYNLAVRGMGYGIAGGQVVFDEVAEISERIGREVEDSLVWLGKKIGKLVSKIAVRCIPYAGWALTAIDFLLNGKEAFTDIWDDAVACFDMVNDLLDLVDEVKAWAETQADRLDTFEQILEAAGELPQVGPHQGIDDLLSDVRSIENTLRDVAEFELGGGEAQDDVEDRLGGIEDRQDDGETEYEGFHKEPRPLEEYPDDEPLPGPDQRLSG